jgi:hypothetical protein
MSDYSQTKKRKTRAELEAELKRLRAAADKVRMLTYGNVTATDGTAPPDQTIYIYTVLGDLDEALGLERGKREVDGDTLHVVIPNVV